MTTSQHGIKSHYMTESIERMTKWLLSIGWDAQEAERGAVVISLVLVDDCPRREAWEAANAITPKQNQPPE